MAICSGFFHEKLPFSIAMLNYQRVFNISQNHSTFYEMDQWDFMEMDHGIVL
jgi:hypothetical protein